MEAPGGGEAFLADRLTYQGFSGLSSDTPCSDQAVTNRSCQDDNAQWDHVQRLDLTFQTRRADPPVQGLEAEFSAGWCGWPGQRGVVSAPWQG
jgi:hypothetical protein